MSTQTPQLISHLLTRLRQPRPDHACIIPNSTPVLSFGDPTQAHFATLGLGPSQLEFQDTDGAELPIANRRLETLTSLGITNLSDAPDAALNKISQGCNTYFCRNPHRRAFEQLELILDAAGASYYNGSACHLDLVQWATSPVWRKLDKPIRASLAASDNPFLLEQLKNPNLRVLLLNGMRVVREYQRLTGIKLTELRPRIMNETLMFIGHGPNGRLTVGWNTNLQPSLGVSHVLREQIAQAVAKAVARNKSAVPARV